MSRRTGPPRVGLPRGTPGYRRDPRPVRATAPRLEGAEEEHGHDAETNPTGSEPQTETILYCERSETSSCVRCWCPACGRWHQHGMPFELGDGPDHRIAHCDPMGGYYIVVDPVRARALADRHAKAKALAKAERRLARLGLS